MRSKNKIPQYELPGSELIFNLRLESAVDGERVQQELDAARAVAQQSEQRQGTLIARPANRAQALAAMQTLRHFIGASQTACVMAAFRSEERQFFYDKMVELAGIVSTMPQTYEQDGKGDETIAYLHYFAGGQANWWITERDKGCPDDPPEMRGQQHQAFGLADLLGEPELGYISIPEILAVGGELDFHFKPRRLAEIRQRIAF